jgi:flagellin-like hook-associated protein FlgL
VLQVEDLKVDRVERRVERAGKRIELTSKEFALLEYLMRNAGRRITRAMIIEHVWNLSFDTCTNVVDVCINYVTAQRVFYGNGLSQTQSQQTYLSTEAQGLTEQTNNISAADLAAVATQLTQDQVAIDATLSSIGRTPATSLFDYLK